MPRLPATLPAQLCVGTLAPCCQHRRIVCDILCEYGHEAHMDQLTAWLPPFWTLTPNARYVDSVHHIQTTDTLCADSVCSHSFQGMADRLHIALPQLLGRYHPDQVQLPLVVQPTDVTLFVTRAGAAANSGID